MKKAQGMVSGGVLSLALLLGGCGTAKVTAAAPSMETVQLVQANYGLQATIPASWTTRVETTGVGSSLIEGTNQGSVFNTTWAVPQKVGISYSIRQGNYIITKVFTPYFSAAIVVPNTPANHILAQRIFRSLKYYSPKKGVI